MAVNNRKASLQLVLAHEGGFVSHPKDPGGATFKGVTQAVYDAYRIARGENIRSVKQMTQTELQAIYDEQYMDRVRFDRLPAGIDYAVFDYAVNSGVAKAIKDAQRTVNQNANYYGVLGKLNVDGVAGNATVAALCQAAQVDETGFIVAYCNRRGKFLKSLKTFSTFGKGWMRRVFGDKDGYQDGDSGVIDYAVKMAREDMSYPLKVTELPTTIGDKAGEVPAKAVASDQSLMKTVTGVGTALGAAGVTGQTLLSTAEAVKPHTTDDGIVGKIALAAFVVLIITGATLVAIQFLKHKREQGAV